MPPTPMKIGMYLFQKMMTSKSDPVVVTVAPGRITVAASGGIVLDAAAQEVGVKRGTVTGAVTLRTARGKMILAAVGSHSGARFTPEQEAEIWHNQHAAAADPQTSQLELGRTMWIGRPTNADGSAGGALQSMREGDAKAQKKIGGIVADAMIAAGARPA